MSIAVDAGKPLPETERLVVGGPAFTESVTAGWGKHTPPSNATPRNMPAIRPADFKLAFILDLLLFFVWVYQPWHPTPVMRKAAVDFTIFREDREGLTGRSLWSADSRFTQHGLRLLPRLAMEGQHPLVVNRMPKGHRPSGCLTGMLPIARRARNRSQYEVGLGELTDAPVGLPIASHVRLRAIHCAIGEYQRRAVVASRSIERGQILLIEGGLLSTIRNAGLYGSARVNRGQ